MAKVWLISGAGRGLGHDIAVAALAAGDRVMATARHTEVLHELVAQYPDSARAFTLDVTDAAAACAAVEAALAQFGRLDVLVNNAGYGQVAPFEQTEDEDFRAQIETNFFGVVNLTRASLPTLRAQRAGHIINISSVGGRIGTPGLSAYQSAKWAVGGFSEVLARELAPFGVSVISVEPGGMRTGWGEIAVAGMPPLLPDYATSVGVWAQLRARVVQHAAGDPARVAQVILRLAERHDLPPHLLLGSDALQYFEQIDQARQQALADWRAVSMSTDVAASGPIPAFPTAAVQS